MSLCGDFSELVSGYTVEHPDAITIPVPTDMAVKIAFALGDLDEIKDVLKKGARFRGEQE